MSYYDDFMRENERGHSTYMPPIEEPRPQSKAASKQPLVLSRKAVAAIALACILSSSAVGFGSGMLAANMNGSMTVPNTTNIADTSVINTPVGGEGILSVSEIARAASDSVVEISTQVLTTNRMMQAVSGEAAGSGVILSKDGYIVTNNHVIDGAQNITVRLKNGESYPATLVGTDPQTDVAVIKIEAENLSAVTLGDSDALQVGDSAVAIGNPLGELGGTVTNGIISATHREISLDGETMNLLQTNAAINPGNSGGGLFNAKGELIGVVVAKSSGSGIEGLGFAIPINDVKAIVADLMSTGYVTGRGQLGVSVVDIQDAQTAFMYRVNQLGVYIAAIGDDSAAQLAGLKVGDRVTSIGDKEVTTSQELKSALRQYGAGETVPVGVVRDGTTMTLNAQLQESVPETVQNQAA